MTKSACLAVFSLVFLAGCMPEPPVLVNLNDGYIHIAGSGTFDCNGQPTAVDGSHKDVELKNGCSRVRVAGSHDNVTVYVNPGAAIEVIGSSDTVIYRLLRRGAAPLWSNTGDKNELLRNSLASWERDHDWYQEQH